MVRASGESYLHRVVVWNSGGKVLRAALCRMDENMRSRVKRDDGGPGMECFGTLGVCW